MEEWTELELRKLSRMEGIVVAISVILVVRPMLFIMRERAADPHARSPGQARLAHAALAYPRAPQYVRILL